MNIGDTFCEPINKYTKYTAICTKNTSLLLINKFDYVKYIQKSVDSKESEKSNFLK